MEETLMGIASIIVLMFLAWCFSVNHRQSDYFDAGELRKLKTQSVKFKTIT